MKRSTIGTLLACQATWLILVAIWPISMAVAQSPPSRVNTSSIQTNSGEPVVWQFPGASPRLKRNGFFHSQPSPRLASRPAYSNGRVINAQQSQQHAEASAMLTQSTEAAPGMVPAPVDDVPPPHSPDSPIILDGAYPACGDCGSCKSCSGDGHGHVFDQWDWVCLCAPVPGDHKAINFGVHGFKGPLNFGHDSSFGFQEGINLGGQIPFTHGVGWQFGLQGVQSNFSGAGITDQANDFIRETDQDRNQLFMTVGAYNRVDWGAQAGFVVDFLQDEWHYDVSLAQVRGEIGWVFSCGHEVGFRFHVGLGDDTSFTPIVDANGVFITVEPTNVFTVFYHHAFDECDSVYIDLFAGATEEREFILGESGTSAVLGGDFHIEMSRNWALETGFAYLTAPDGAGSGAKDSWNVDFNFIWYPYGSTVGTGNKYFRPLFNAADNGSFFTHLSR